MQPLADLIRQQLHTVAQQRAVRARDPALAERVRGLKAYQQQRFRRTYADLLEDSRFGPPTRFFLEELYGPGDFSERDAQFERIVGPLVRLFPEDVTATVAQLARLHALSETLDTVMAQHAPTSHWSPSVYVHAWQSTGGPADRERQIHLMLDIGEALERYTRNPLLRHSLRAMRGPSRAAGLSALQRFLETGFETFRQMRGAQPFLRTVAERERQLCEALFTAEVVGDDVPVVARAGPLVQLP